MTEKKTRTEAIDEKPEDIELQKIKLYGKSVKATNSTGKVHSYKSRRERLMEFLNEPDKDNKTRAELMAEKYPKKLEELEPKKPKVHILENPQRTPEEEARLAAAIEKLRDFIDLIK